MRYRCNVLAVICVLAVLIGEVHAAPEEPAAPQHGQATFRVRVIDKLTSQPIAGARVKMRSGDRRSSNSAEIANDEKPRDPRAADTNDRGSSRCGPLATGRHAIEVAADGYVTQAKEFLVGGGKLEAEIEFRLSPSVPVEGTVRDVDGAPLSAQVTFQVAPPEYGKAVLKDADGRELTGPMPYYPLSSDWGQEIADEMTTDANGNYRLPSVPVEEDVWLQAWTLGSNYAFGKHRLRATADSPPGRVDLTLKPMRRGGSVEGIVVTPDGRPAVGALVEARYTRWPVHMRRERVQATTGADGRFRLDIIMDGTAQLYARAPGYALTFSRIPVRKQDGGDEPKIVLKRGRRLRAKVIDERDAPLAGVDVQIASDGGPGTRLCSTDAEGRFEADILPEASRFTLFKTGYSPIWSSKLEVQEAEETVIVMKRAGVIRAKVVSAADGRPIPEFALGRGAGRPLHVFAGDGSFEVDEAWRGINVVEAQGYLREFIPRMAPAAPGEGGVVEIAMRVDDPASYVQYGGRVTDDSGLPVADVELRLLCASDEPGSADDAVIINSFDSIVEGRAEQHRRIVRCQSAKSDDEGRFAFAGVPSTRRVFMVWWKQGMAPGKQTDLERLTGAARGQLEVRVQPAASVVLHIDRQEYPEADVFFSRPFLDPVVSLYDRQQVKLKPGQDAVEFKGLAPGTYQVLLRSGPRQANVLLRRYIRLRSGEQSNIDINAQRRERDRARGGRRRGGFSPQSISDR